MSLFGSPAPQWVDLKNASGLAKRLQAVLDASGFWTLIEGVTPSGAYRDDATGFTVIDDTITTGLNPTLLPSGNVVIY